MHRKLVALLLFVLIILTSIPRNTYAQIDEIWSEGVNISRSGSSSSPSFVISSQGLIHVFWLDEFDGLMYSQGAGTNWSMSQSVNVPNDVSVPSLYSGINNQIHAFWVDDEGKLFYNRANGDNLGNSNVWSGSTVLGESVVFFDVAITADGAVHLAYLQTSDLNNQSAGVYYRKSNSSGSSWQPPILVYGSRYFRALGRDSANLQIGVPNETDSQEIFIAWDNRPLKTVFFARSLNGGTEWEQPVEIASPQNRPSATTPYNVQMGLLQNQIMLVYQDGQPGFSCSQSFQYSEDNGVTWSEPKRMMEDIPGCALSSQLIEVNDQYLLLMTVNRDQVLLTAWNGNHWSKSKQQTEMMQVIDPLTRTSLTLTSQQILIDPEGYLNFISADLEQGDIWWKRRNLDDIVSWFQQDSSWIPFETITIENNSLSSITITSDSRGQPHVFWGSSNEDDPGIPANTIYYSMRESQGRWLKPILVHQSTNQFVDHLSANFDSTRNNLILVWRDGIRGEIYFSTAPANQAFLTTSWSVPVLISSPNQVADFPKILLDSSGKLIVIYSVPLNEERGVYLTTSNDGGLSWTQPARILNGLTYGFEAINNPQMAIAGENTYHLIWVNSQLVENRLYPISIYYSRSLDSGQTWTEPSNIIDAQVIWGQILASSNGVIHRIWQEYSGSQNPIWHEYSTNGGESWSRVTLPSLLGEKIGTPAVSMDASGRIHLLQLSRANDNNASLQYLMWENDWRPEQAKEFDFDLISSSSSPGTVFSANGNLQVALSAATFNMVDNRSENLLLFTEQRIENLPLLETPSFDAGIEVNPETSTSTPSLQQPTLEQTKTPQLINTTPAPIINPTIGILIGSLLSLLVIAVIVIYHIWQKTSG